MPDWKSFRFIVNSECEAKGSISQGVLLPLGSLRHWAHWSGSPPGRGGPGDRLHPEDLTGVSVCFGAWLYPDHAVEDHTIEVENIAVE